MNHQDIKKISQEFWGTNPAGWTFANNLKKGSTSFFKKALKRRFSEECPWLHELIPFKQLKHKKVLEIGFGAGFDAYYFCKYQAQYTGVDITPQNAILAQQHLSSYTAFTPTFLTQDVEEMTFENTFDYAYSYGVLHHTPAINKALDAIYKALKPGGTCLIIVYNKHSINYWLSTIMTEWIFKRGFLKRSLAEQRSLIEYTASSLKPLVNVYSKKQLGTYMKQAGFAITNATVNKLTREDIRSIKILGKLEPYISDSLLNKLSKKYGWYLCVQAQKPLNT